MGRPAKSVYAKSGEITKEDFESRKYVEDELRGNVNDIENPPDYLSDLAKKIYRKLFTKLKDSKVIGTLDGPLLAETATVMAHLIIDNNRMNEAYESSKDDKTINLIRSRITSLQRSFFRCCNELCLSPQSRSKLSIAISNTDDKSVAWLDECEELFED